MKYLTSLSCLNGGSVHTNVHITPELLCFHVLSNSDVMSAIIDSDVWVEAMRQCRGKAAEYKMTPLRMMIERMPGNNIVIREPVIW